MKLTKSLTLIPFYRAPSSWWEHVPIAHWLVENLEPKIIVELGSHYGVSFFSFCEAAQHYSEKSFIYAIDTWKGDKQAGYYDNTVYQKVENHHRLHHQSRSGLVRETFDNAAKKFGEELLDLVHIDGLHTYEAVKNDFKTWSPKLKEGGSILFHDCNVREKDFGVWKLWEEIKLLDNYQCVEVLNGHGLGIATKTKEKPSWHSELEEILPILVSKGSLLDQLERQRMAEVKQIEYSRERDLHIKNLEKISKENTLHIDSLKQELLLQAQKLVEVKRELSMPKVKRICKLLREFTIKRIKKEN